MRMYAAEYDALVAERDALRDEIKKAGVERDELKKERNQWFENYCLLSRQEHLSDGDIAKIQSAEFVARIAATVTFLYKH